MIPNGLVSSGVLFLKIFSSYFLQIKDIPCPENINHMPKTIHKATKRDNPV